MTSVVSRLVALAFAFTLCACTFDLRAEIPIAGKQVHITYRSGR
jgi:hypothetical protein